MRVADLLLVTILISQLSGCGGGGPGGGNGPSLPSSGGSLITGDTTAPQGSIVPFAELRQMSRGAPLKIRLNRAGFEIREYTAFFLSAFTDAGDELIACQLEDGAVVAAGDSGAPVYMADGRRVGALAFGTSDKKFFLARSRAQMESLKLQATASASSSGSVSVTVTTTSGATLSQNFTPVPPEMLLNGISPNLLSKASRFGRSGILGRFRPISRRQLARLQSNLESSLKPGSSISINFIDGELLRGGAIGSVTDVEGNQVLALGHELDQRGRRALPVSLAAVDSIADGGLFGLFKLAHPEGPNIGALTNDRRFGVVITPGVEPATVAVKTIIRKGSNEALTTYSHRVAADRGSFEEIDLILVTLVAPVDFVRDERGPGSADATLTLVVGGETLSAQNFRLQSDRDLMGQLFSELITRLDDSRREGTSFTSAQLAIHLTS